MSEVTPILVVRSSAASGFKPLRFIDNRRFRPLEGGRKPAAFRGKLNPRNPLGSYLPENCHDRDSQSFALRDNKRWDHACGRTSMMLSRSLAASVLALCLAGPAPAQTQSPAPPSTSPPDAPVPAKQNDADQQSNASTQSERDKAAEQVRQQEKQRIAGVVPNFNVSYNADAAPLSRTQKLQIALRTATDPVAFGIAGFDAGLSQAQNDFPGYGQGAQGYAKRFGASYADNFDGTMLGNAIFPILLKQDPRYFRRGTGSFTRRFFYSLSTTVWCKNDNGKWGPNYSNILGNLAAGGISNLYYPASDRGAGLTFERGFTVTAYGAFGGVFNEFWPDIAKKILKNNMAKLQPKVPPPTTASAGTRKLHFKSMTTIRPSDSKLPPVAVFAVVSGLRASHTPRRPEPRLRQSSVPESRAPGRHWRRCDA